MFNSGLYKANILTNFGGYFRVKINTIMNPRNKDKLSFFTLNIGNDECFCLTLTINMDGQQSHYLSKIEATSKKCSCTLNDLTIRGERTRQMLYFAATIIKEISNIPIIEFTDQSSFPCMISDGVERQLPLNIYNFMFKGKTWYHQTFNAKLKEPKEQSKYKVLQERRTNPEFKPDTFYFGTESLTNELDPLYKKTSTWAEFFDEIANKYKEEKCRIVYPWLHQAMYILINNDADIFGFQKWEMDVRNMSSVNYEIKKLHRNGSHYTRKNGGGRKNSSHKNIKNEENDMVYDAFVPRELIFKIEDLQYYI
jgi:hypothetical protein